MQLRLLNVAVDGGDLRVLLWGTGKRVAVAVHGITASGMSWQAVARHMPPDWTLAAPDLRGRGHSARPARPVRPGQARPRRGGGAAPFRRTAGARRAFDGRVRRAAGPRRAPGTGAAARPGGRRAAAAGAGGHRPGRRARRRPSARRSPGWGRRSPAPRRTWTSGGRIRRWPATGPPTSRRTSRYDLTGEPGQLRSRVAGDAVRADGRDVLAEKPFADALGRLTRPTPLLTAPAGMFGEPPAADPPEVVAAWAERVPALRPQAGARGEPLHDHVRQGGRGGGAAAITRRAR